MSACLSLTHQSYDYGKDWVDPLVCQKVDGGLTPLSLVEVHMLTIPDITGPSTRPFNLLFQQKAAQHGAMAREVLGKPSAKLASQASPTTMTASTAHAAGAQLWAGSSLSSNETVSCSPVELHPKIATHLSDCSPKNSKWKCLLLCC